MFLLKFLIFLSVFGDLVWSNIDIPSSMPTEHQKLVQEEYQKFMKQREQEKKAKAKANLPPIPKGISPKELGMKRSGGDVELNEQKKLNPGTYWFGTQMYAGNTNKILPNGNLKDGADVRKKVAVKSFWIDVDCVTNEQFSQFVKETNYVTESELYGWSFVFENQVSADVKAEVDGEQGYGRVKDAPHWMAVKQASWKNPYGLDSTYMDKLQYPVVHVSHKDADEYCIWAGLRLPTEQEWEYAARGGKVNQSYPWGNKFRNNSMNIWEGDEFPTHNFMLDGHNGPAPVKTYPPNDYGLYNMLGNVWEWVKGGTHEARILRGGSFIDSIDGKFNHAVKVSTRQINSGDSGASNIGFRCAKSLEGEEKIENTKSSKKKRQVVDEEEHIEL